MTNRTIAVDPTVIPYGSKVVINGQVYVAEDCGGAIKNNHIDIYVGSHAEAETKGVYETEVYLLEEDDLAYTFAIPKSVLEFDTGMPDNLREQRKYSYLVYRRADSGGDNEEEIE